MMSNSAAAIVAFASVSLLIAISPGPSWIYVITARVRGGSIAGRFAILGNATGILIHCLAVTAGIATLLSVSRSAFFLLQFAGSGYLIFLGIKILLRDPLPNRTRLEAENAEEGRRGQFYRGAVLMAVLNPKISLLMLALLPQFVDPARGIAALQIVTLGLVHMTIASTVLSVVAATAGSLTSWLEQSERARRLFRGVNGSLLIAFGIGLALARRTTG